MTTADASARRWGITVPFDTVPLAEQREWFVELEDRGYTDVWSAEADGADAFTPLVLASQWAPSLRLGQAIVPVYTRGPAVLAQQIATLAGLAPGRTVLGLGTSTPAIVQRWNGIPFERPAQRMTDTVRWLRESLSGAKVTGTYETISATGFRLRVPAPDPAVPIMVAALRPGMLRVAGREGDGAILNWLSAADVGRVAPIVAEAAPEGARREIVARIFVAPSDNRDEVLALGRFVITAYLAAAPAYAEFHRWLGRGELLAPMWAAWDAGDRAGAAAAIPESVVDELILSGPAASIVERVEQYVANGVTCPVLAVLPFPSVDQRAALAALAPR